ncbi:MAG: DUF917 family protein [Acidobacteriota bacterium]
MFLNSEMVDFAALGGAFLGGGGGGSLEEGRRLGGLAVRRGRPTLVRMEEIPADATLVTVSAVGAPAAPEASVDPADYIRTIELLRLHGIHPAGLIASESGGLATLNGWYQAAALGIPVVDAPCNGRAHPLGLMGSMGLHALEGYRSIQAASGGSRTRQQYLEIVVTGRLADTAHLIRLAAVQAGGLVAVARNPVRATYAARNAASGAVAQAIEIGRRIRGARSCRAAVEAVLDYLGGGEVAAEGCVEGFALETTGGFDVGSLRVGSDASGYYDLSFCNEYVCMEREGMRLATFPDLMTTMNSQTGLPVTTAQIEVGMPLVVVCVPRRLLKLGAGMRDLSLFRPLEEMTGKEIVRYL